MTAANSNERDTSYDDANPAAGEYFPVAGDFVRFPLACLPENRGRVYEIVFVGFAPGYEENGSISFRYSPPDRPTTTFSYVKHLRELRRIGMEKVVVTPRVAALLGGGRALEAELVRPGQVWADRTPDLVGRTVRILRTNETHAFFEVLTPSNSAWSPEKSVGRKTSCSLRRFRDNKTGFRLVTDTPQPGGTGD